MQTGGYRYSRYSYIDGHSGGMKVVSAMVGPGNCCQQNKMTGWGGAIKQKEIGSRQRHTEKGKMLTCLQAAGGCPCVNMREGEWNTT